MVLCGLERLPHICRVDGCMGHSDAIFGGFLLLQSDSARANGITRVTMVNDMLQPHWCCLAARRVSGNLQDTLRLPHAHTLL